MQWPQIKLQCATIASETVQHDLCSRFDHKFMLLIDERIMYNMGGHTFDKRGPTITRALYKLWVRVWGPPQNLSSDQEGGLLSIIAPTNEALSKTATYDSQINGNSR